MTNRDRLQWIASLLKRRKRSTQRRMRVAFFEQLEDRRPLAAEDYGDAPTAAQSGFAATYPTLLAANGARHTPVAGFSIGNGIDTEADGQPNADSTLDDATGTPDDEDGVVVSGTLSVGNAGAIRVFVTNSAGVSDPYLDAWIDFNRDGDWADSGEMISTGAAVAGTNTLNFTVPAGASAGQTFARFRLHDGTTALAVTGLSANGEVEDHLVSIASSGTWAAQGPAPSRNGQVENVTPNDEVVGAIHTVIAHPTNPNLLYAGTVNGGIWRTTNGTASSPTWTPLTDDQPGLSTGALEFDPTDATSQTIVAGIGRFSSFASNGGARSGLLRTTDGGSTWSAIDGGGLLAGKNISGAAARGSTIVVSVNFSVPFTFGKIGIFRSTDGGISFLQVSGGSGLPLGLVYDLAGHANAPSVLYAAVRQAGASNGIYKSTDTGANWVQVSNAVMNALIRDTNPGTGSTSNVEIAIHDNSTTGTNAVYVAILNGGQLTNGGVFRSQDGGTSWTAMDTPVTNENGTVIGTNPRFKPNAGEPSGQGAIHFSIVADPINANLVYVGGDRQPRANGDAGSFPNSIGATDFSGRLFRGNASLAAGSQWVHLTHSNSLGAAGGGTSNSSAPHADSREMVFDANGNIIEVDDGGIYRRTSPGTNTGDWFSINGNLQVTEAHDVAYDPISNILISGNQDTGSTEQFSTGSQAWRSVSTGDGGDVAIDSITLAGSNQSIRYSSFQEFQDFRRRIVDNNNNVISTVFPALTVSGGGDPFLAQFDTPIALNAIDPRRIIFGGDSGLYESTNQGDTITQVAASVITPSSTSNPIAYGGRSGGTNNVDVVYAGAEDGKIHVRTASGGAFTSTDPSGTSSDAIRDVRLDPDEWKTAFAIDNDQVFTTTTNGSSWTDITGDLVAGSVMRSLEYIVGTVDAVAVGTDMGVFVSLVTSLGTWFQFGSNLPKVPVWDMDYDATDDVLAIGTLGRGVWTIPNASIELFESPKVTVEDITAVEGAGLTFTVTLDKAVAGGTTVNVSLANVTAIGGAAPLVSPEDFDNAVAALTFTGTAGETKTFTVATLNDVVLEGTETFTVNLDAVNALVTDTDTAIGTITDNDDAKVTVENITATEGTGLTFTVTLDKAVQSGTTVNVSLANVTAIGGAAPLVTPEDFDNVVGALTFTGTVGETKTFTVATLNDVVLEGTESFTVNLDATNPLVTDTDTATGTITDNDDAKVTVENIAAAEGAGLTFTVTLDRAVQSGTTVNVSLANVTATGGAAPLVTPEDFDNVVAALIFTGTAGETKSFTVATLNDVVLEGTETFTVNLDAVNTLVTDTDTATGTITDNDDAKVTVENITAVEGAGLTFTVTLDKAVQGAFDVNVSLANVTATGGEAPLVTPEDFDNVVAGLTFAGTAGETKTFIVATLNDVVLEETETFTVNLDAVNTLVADTDTATGTITDNDDAKVTVENITAVEGAGLTFTVTLDKAVQTGTTVNVSLGNVTATGGAAPLVTPEDFDNVVEALTFTGTAGETKTFIVATLNDVLLEGTETFTVNLDAVNASVTDTDTATGTITDNDDAKVTVENITVAEGADLTFTVTLDKAVVGGTTVNVSLADVTATGGAAPLVSPEDFNNVVAALAFTGTAGETKTFTVDTLNDSVLEGTETFTVNLDAVNALVTDTDTATGTITDNDDARVTVENIMAVEGAGLMFTVTLDNAVQGAFDLNVSLANVTATGGAAPLVSPEDFNNVVAALAFTGTAGETKTFTVDTLNDSVLEGTETFTVNLDAVNALVTDTDTATGTITDNDDARVTVENIMAVEGAGLMFTVTLDNAVQGAFDVNVSLANVTADGGAALLMTPEDFDNVVDALTFTGTAGETKTFTVDTLNDLVLEGTETFTVNLDAVNALVTDTDTATGTITDNDDARVTVENIMAVEGAGLMFTVTLDNAVQGAFDLNVSLANVTATGGEAPLLTPEDFDNVVGALTFTGSAGETKQFTVASLDDIVLEETETFLVSLDATNALVTDTDTAIGTITDNDDAAVTVEDFSVVEGVGLVFTVTLDNAVQGAFDVNVSLADVTADGGAAPLVTPEDFDNVVAALSFTGTAGETKTFAVETLDDFVLEETETFLVSLDATNALVTNIDTATGTITDNDDAAVTVEDVTVVEGVGLMFTVSLDNAVQGSFDVNVSLANMTATGGEAPLVTPEDFDIVVAALNFTGTAGQTKTFTVETLDDIVLEETETFLVSLDATNALVTNTDTATGTITDNDDATVTVEDVTVVEGIGLLFTVTLDNGVQGAFDVNVSLANVTADGGTAPLVTPEDFDNVVAALSFTGTAGETKMFTVETLDDFVLEETETFLVSLDATNALVTNTDTATGTITDNDDATVTVEDVTVVEGIGLLFTVTLDNGVQGAFDVNVSLANVTADGGAAPLVTPEDFDNVVAALSFTGTAGETKTFAVETLDDFVLEETETFLVSLDATNALVTNTDTATGTITDNDDATLTVEDVTVVEGVGLLFTVTLDNGVQGAFDVNVSLANVTATGGASPLVTPEDVDNVVGALSFTGTAGETKTFTVETLDDIVLEETETFLVSLDATNALVTDTDTAMGTITDNDDATLTVEDVTVVEGVGLLFTVTLDNAVQGAFDVNVTLANMTATGGEAPLVTPEDYDNVVAALSFAGTAGEKKQFAVATLDDIMLEETETFLVSLDATNALVTVIDTATGTITDNDDAAVTVADITVVEGVGLLFTVTLDNAVQGSFDVNVSLANMTATGGEAPLVTPEDFDNVVGALSFTGTAGETKTFTVETLDDIVLEETETFLVSLDATNGLVTVTDTATGTITDNDDATITVEDVTVVEGVGLLFTVTLDNAVQGSFDVNVSLANVTATVGEVPLVTPEDYDNVVAALSFAGTAGEKKQFTVATLDDIVLEETETFGVSLDATNALVTETDTATGTITDNDDAKVTVENITMLEGAGLTFTVTLDNAVQGAFDVNVSLANVTADGGAAPLVTPEDFDNVVRTLSFMGNAGEEMTFTVATLDDVVVDGTESFIVNLDATNAMITDSDTATGTITDGDMAGFIVIETQDSSVITESGTTDTIEVMLTAQPLSDVVLTITSDDTSEVTIDQETLTFMPSDWNVPKTVIITGVRDLLDDGDQLTAIKVSVVQASTDDAFDLVPDLSIEATTVDEPVDQLAITLSDEAVIVTNSVTGAVLIEELLAGLASFTIVTGDGDKMIDVGNLTNINVEFNIHSGGGNDTFTLAEISFQQILGGQGHDTLRLGSEQNHLDLPALDDVRLNGIEEIDIRGSGRNTLTLDVNEVLNLSDTSDTLFVLSDLDDTVNINAGWTLTGNQITDGTFYRVLEKNGATLMLNGPANWQNPVNRRDVNNDGIVSPVGDILPLINEINQKEIISSSGMLPEPPVEPDLPKPFFDVNGDGHLTPVGDILAQINFVNTQNDPDGESQFETGLPFDVLVSSVIHSSYANLDAHLSQEGRRLESFASAELLVAPYSVVRIDIRPRRVPNYSVIDRLLAEDLDALLLTRSDLEDVLDEVFAEFK